MYPIEKPPRSKTLNLPNDSIRRRWSKVAFFIAHIRHTSTIATQRGQLPLRFVSLVTGLAQPQYLTS